jgi:hypothetical protein
MYDVHICRLSRIEIRGSVASCGDRDQDGSKLIYNETECGQLLAKSALTGQKNVCFATLLLQSGTQERKAMAQTAVEDKCQG